MQLPEYSESTIEKVAEGDVMVVTKYKGKTYAKAFRFDDPKVGIKARNALEATQRILNANT